VGLENCLARLRSSDAFLNFLWPFPEASPRGRLLVSRPLAEALVFFVRGLVRHRDLVVVGFAANALGVLGAGGTSFRTACRGPGAAYSRRPPAWLTQVSGLSVGAPRATAQLAAGFQGWALGASG